MSKLVYVPPPVYALLALGACHGLAIWLPIPLDLSAPSLGILLILLAVGLLAWAAWSFRRRSTTPLPTGTPSALVDAGPYRWTRNPMYLALVIALTSVSPFTGSPWYLLAPPAFWLIANTVFIPYEEAKLDRLFGQEYQDFRARVRRWL